MPKRYTSIEELTDEQVLKEFVRRFECDGAVLVYLEKKTEFGFGRWRNATGRNWVHTMFDNLQQTIVRATPQLRKAQIESSQQV